MVRTPEHQAPAAATLVVDQSVDRWSTFHKDNDIPNTRIQRCLQPRAIKNLLTLLLFNVVSKISRHPKHLLRDVLLFMVLAAIARALTFRRVR